MSNFTDVQKMNLVFGNAFGNLSNVDWNKAKMYADLIQEELNEIYEAIENKDVQELVDGNMDVLVVAYGLAHVSGIEADKGMRIVYESNMSKVCPTLCDARKTQDWYQEKYQLETYLEETVIDDQIQYIVKVKNDHESNGKFFPKGKFLKCVTTFKEPELEQLITK